jgi:hypothetical protein
MLIVTETYFFSVEQEIPRAFFLANLISVLVLFLSMVIFSFSWVSRVFLSGRDHYAFALQFSPPV